MTRPITAVTMPKWGIEMTEGTISGWNFGIGQAVGRGEALLDVETEKIVNSVEAPAQGILRRILADKGETRPVGALIAVFAPPEVGEAEIDAFVGAFRGAIVSFEPDAAATDNEEPPTAAPAGEGGEPHVSPIARRLAERLGVDLGQVRGTGRNGRISKEDVEAFVAATAGASGTSSAAAAGNPARRVAMSSMRATIARRLLESAQSIPHYRVSADVRMDMLQARRDAAASDGVRPTLNDALVHAVSRALREHPGVNAQFSGDEILEFRHADIAIAVATEDGLVTPVVRAADRLGLADIAVATRDLVDRAQRSTLTREDIAGGTFTISNLGMLGVDRFDAIINPPQVAILAVGAITDRVVAHEGVPVIARMATLTLSADHRVVDGALAARFLGALKALVEAPGGIE